MAVSYSYNNYKILPTLWCKREDEDEDETDSDPFSKLDELVQEIEGA